MTLLSKHEKRDSNRLPNAANLSKSLILSLFLYFFTCFVTEDIPSPHGSRQWLECPQYTGTNHTSVYEGTYQVYASPSIRALDQATLHFMDNCRVVFSFTKKEISTRQGQYLFLLIISHLSSIKATNWNLFTSFS